MKKIPSNQQIIYLLVEDDIFEDESSQVESLKIQLELAKLTLQKKAREHELQLPREAAQAAKEADERAQRARELGLKAAKEADERKYKLRELDLKRSRSDDSAQSGPFDVAKNARLVPKFEVKKFKILSVFREDR